MLKIVSVPEKVLRKKAKKVVKIDKKILKLIGEMKKTLAAQKDPPGIGLAAPQIGKSLQVSVINYQNRELVLINPEVLGSGPIEKVNPEETPLEGCLSLIDYYGPINRSSWVKVKYLNEKGQEVEEKFTGFLAHVVQHEIDHLNGILFVDRILEQKQSLFKFTGEEYQKVELI